MKTLPKIVVTLVLFLISVSAFAQDSDSIKSKFEWYAYPFLFYSPETNLAFGAGGVVYFQLSSRSNSKSSTVIPSFYYSIDNQYELVIVPDLYFDDDFYHVYSDFRFGKYIDKYYGIGNETPDIADSDYLLNSFKVNLDAEFMLFNPLNFGITYEFRNVNIIDERENPYLKNSPGSEGGINSGLGYLISFDTRDNIFYPSKGSNYKIRVVYFMKALGGDFDFNHYSIDLRKYFSIASNHILALQLFGVFKRGNPPFYDLALLGGETIMRGYFKGRYRDNNLMAAQLEYRTRFGWDRLGMVLFLGYGDVAGSLTNFRLDQLKYSYGAGLRFRLDEKEKIDVRMDIGLGKNTDGVYFSVQQAF